MKDATRLASRFENCDIDPDVEAVQLGRIMDRGEAAPQFQTRFRLSWMQWF